MPTSKKSKDIIFPRWNIKSHNEDLCVAASIADAWRRSRTQSTPFYKKIRDINKSLVNICNISMRSSTSISRLPPQAWWSTEIKALRVQCQKSRRIWQRLKKKLYRNRVTPEVVISSEKDYRNIKKKLKLAINNAKNKQWQIILNGIDDDPWGRPYKWATKKDKFSGTPLTEHINSDLLQRILDNLFPFPPIQKLKIGTFGWSDEWSVTDREVESAVKNMMKKNSAPGLSG
ncbi:uncharacterized protein LOC108625976, partial [Ceratina calcarata]|uniref:Uncharacterized protein LOC108625976 n=1 Tax=Ceratina calcarata TaxID=156304 RepID=A0AAJ7N7S2_9HYME